MPAPSTAAQARPLQAVWDLFYAASRWPTFAELDGKLDRDHDMDLAAVAPTLPTGLLLPPDLRYVQGSEPIRLSVAGAKACTNSNEELKVFLAAVRTAAIKERTHVGPDGSIAELAADDLRQLPELPAAGRDHILLRVGMLLGAESWGWSSYAQGDPSTPNWRFSVGRDVRRLRAVQTLDDFWAITHPATAENYFQPARSIERLEEPTVTEEQTVADPRKVFVIHGRNDRARRGVFSFLRSIGLEPIEWSRAIAMTGKGSPYIGEVLNVAFSEAQAVLVLQTPDDVAHLHESLTYPGDPDSNPQMQPRPNVLFEAGMALARNEDRTIIVELGQIRGFSDIHGRHVVRLNNSIEKRQDLATRLRTAGCSVDLDGADWHKEGDLTPPAPPGGGLPLGRKLPSSKASGQPRLSVALSTAGKDSERMTITNHGPGDVYDLDFELADNREGTREWREVGFPVPKLPEGKSVAAARYLTFDSSTPAYFTVIVTGRTADGEEVRQEEFVSGR